MERLLAYLACLPLLALARGGPAEVVHELPDWSERDLARIARLAPLPPPPADPTNRVAEDPRAATLGQMLFFEKGLSGPATISCATCHDPAKLFQDGLPVPNTLGKGARKTPGLLGVAHQRWFFWDGRADTLWSQALGPIENPIEMDGDRTAVAHCLARAPELRAAYEELFGPLPELARTERFPDHARPAPEDAAGELDRAWRGMREEDRAAIDRVYANVGKAIAAYERLLQPPPAPFDRFVAELLAAPEHRSQVLEPAAQRGLALFLGRARCILCHNGPTFSDQEFHNTGAPLPPEESRPDPGRRGGIDCLLESPFQAGGVHSDDPEGGVARRTRSLRPSSETWGEFKTPSLRNLLGRGPYMHAGQLATLAQVVHFYSTLEGSAGRSHHQELTLVRLDLSETESAELLAFLGSLQSPALPAELLGPLPRRATPGSPAGER